MRDLRTMNMTESQRIESDVVMKRIGDLSYRNLGTIAKMGLIDSGKALIVGDGLRVEPSSGMTVNVPSGVVFQRFNDVFPCIQLTDQTVTIDASTGVPRTDIIEAQIKVIADKNDVAQVGTVSSGTSVSITNETIKRDIKYYLATRKLKDTTTPTSGTSGVLTGTVAISGTIDLSEKYLLNLADGEDGSFQEIDCRGTTPEATTLTEIISAINTATGRTMASAGSGPVLVLTGNGLGQTSYFQIKPPVTDADKDCANIILGLSIGGIYKYTYSGNNPWFKIAEIDVGASTTTITSGLIRNIDQKNTWSSESSEIIVKNNIYKPIGDRTSVTTILDDDNIPLENTNGFDRTITGYSLKSVINNVSPALSLNNLIIINNSSNPNYQLDVSFDGLKVGPFYETSFSDTIDITTDLINGTESASTWYDIVQFSGIGQSTIVKFVENGVAFTLPTNYTDYRIIGNIYNDASSNFYVIEQHNNIIGYSSGVVVLSNGPATTNTLINISAFIPPNITKRVEGRLSIGAAGSLYVSSTLLTAFCRINIRATGEATESYTVPIFTNQSLFYFALNSAISNNNITIASYEINI